MSGPLYRKTEAGVDEMATRRHGLDPRARALLILCNGSNDVALLAERIGPHTHELLMHLRGMGLIEAAPVAEPRSEARPELPGAAIVSPMAVRPGRLVAPPPAGRTMSLPGLPPAVPAAVDTLRRAWRVLPKLGEVLAAERAERAARGPEAPLQFVVAEADLAATRQRAVVMVEALWGPGGGDRVRPVRQAASVDALASALQELYDAAVVFQGRKRADTLMRRVLQGD